MADLESLFGHLDVRDLVNVVSASPAVGSGVGTDVNCKSSAGRDTNYKACIVCGSTLNVCNSGFSECPRCQTISGSLAETDATTQGRISMNFKSGSEHKDMAKPLISKLRSIFTGKMCTLKLDENVFMLAVQSATKTYIELKKHVTHRGNNLTGILVYLVRLYLEHEGHFISKADISLAAGITPQIYNEAETLMGNYNVKYKLNLPEIDRTKLRLQHICASLSMHKVCADMAYDLLQMINNSPIPSCAKEDTRIAGILYYITTFIPQCTVTVGDISTKTGCKQNTFKAYYKGNLQGKEHTEFRTVFERYATVQ